MLNPALENLVPLPRRISRLRLSPRGFPVPWFVAWVDGVPDFRVADMRKLPVAVNGKLCWICGEKLGRYLAFVIGPMCALNRVSSEPPSHRECAIFAAKACPFLTHPQAKRREANLPDAAVRVQDGAGVGLTRNPGVTLVWVTESYKPFREGRGVLFDLGPPTECLWLAQGREATREEVQESIDTGLPLLRAMAEEDGPVAIFDVERRLASALTLLP